ncbi:NAD(P)/FAD-dependent oxidoreductase [Sneathiella aquimaris]|uniref:NAD(P)/FAD-dependent oxidoreductase n=1 Tax=Sneathiella aquimaris TaxID=2599305 RepID=UPI00146AEC44|nr:FAD-dependent oxidoreductase [Sneathiella aquimaris]
MINIAIIGAGLSGLTAANMLKDRFSITLFDKSRGVGGRLATRRSHPYNFDHGAQFFSPKTDDFKAFIAPMIQAGVIEPWEARFAEIDGRKVTQQWQWDTQKPHYVGVPGMNAIGKYLAKGLEVKLNTPVKSIKQIGENWHLDDEHGNALGAFDWVISTIPPKQAAQLVPANDPVQQILEATSMSGCFSVMLGFETPLPLAFDAALVVNENISWISANQTKPGRENSYSLLVHSTNKWADAHLDDDREDALKYLCEHASEIVGHDLSKAVHKSIHGWRFANIEKQSGPSHFCDAQRKIALCGDYFIQGRMEAAFTSGKQVAQTVLSAASQGNTNA